MYKQLILMLLLAGSGMLQAQPLTFVQADKLTYNDYQQGQWKSLLRDGRQARASRLRFYYLDYRMGTAAYHLKKYRLAETYYEQARKFNGQDAGLNEALYLTLQENEKTDEALHLSRVFPEALAKKLHTEKLPWVNEADVNFYEKISDQPSYYGTLYYTGGGFNHRIGRGISLYHHYQYLTQNVIIATLFQHQYFVQADIPLPQHFTLQPAFSYIAYKLYYADATTLPTQNFADLYSLNIMQSLPWFDWLVTPSYSTFNNTWQAQVNAGFVVYPLAGNQCRIGYQYLAEADTSGALRAGHLIYLGIRPTSSLDLKATYYTGNLRYGHFLNGYTVYDQADLLQNRIGVNATYQVNTRSSVDVYYSHERKSNTRRPTVYYYNVFGTSLKITL